MERDWVGTTGDGYEAIVKGPTGGRSGSVGGGCGGVWWSLAMACSAELSEREHLHVEGMSTKETKSGPFKESASASALVADGTGQALGKHRAGHGHGQACFSNKGSV